MPARLTIVSLGDNSEGIGLRAMLESMDHEVRLLRATNAADVNAALRRASDDNVTILSARGGPRGFQIATGWIAPIDAFDGVSFGDDSVLMSTAAATRENGLVQVMLNAGGHLVAPDGTPDRHVIVPWIGACLLCAENGLADAVRSANALVAPHNRFSYG